MTHSNRLITTWANSSVLALLLLLLLLLLYLIVRDHEQQSKRFIVPVLAYLQRWTVAPEYVFKDDNAHLKWD